MSSRIEEVAECNHCHGKVLPEKFWDEPKDEGPDATGECPGRRNGEYCGVHTQEEVQRFESK